MKTQHTRSTRLKNGVVIIRSNAADRDRVIEYYRAWYAARGLKVTEFLVYSL